MNGKSLWAASFGIACLGVWGCEKSPPPSSAAPATPPATTAAPMPEKTAAPATPVATAPAVNLEAVPAREDFEEEAETQITPANLEKQLEALEKEIAAE